MESFKLPVFFQQAAGNLKFLKRTGWTRYSGIKEVEHVTDHSYRVGLLSMLFLNDPSIDASKCVQMGLLHDLAESIVGDITPYDNVSKEDKKKLEIEALKKICSELPEDMQNKFMELWLDFEEGRTPEGLLVKDMDTYEMVLQAYEYENKYPDVDLIDFFKSKERIKNPTLKKWADELFNKRKQNANKQNN